MKNVVAAIALSLTVFSAHADCISKATKTLDATRMGDTQAYISITGAAALNVAAPFIIGLMTYGKYREGVYYFRELMQDAKKGKGARLDKFAEEIRESRPDLAEDKARLAEILREANEKETVCGSGVIFGPLLRTLVMGGDVEAANAENRKISVSDFNNRIDG